MRLSIVLIECVYIEIVTELKFVVSIRRFSSLDYKKSRPQSMWTTQLSQYNTVNTRRRAITSREGLN
jgi:hypothetical protein